MHHVSFEPNDQIGRMWCTLCRWCASIDWIISPSRPGCVIVSSGCSARYVSHSEKMW